MSGEDIKIIVERFTHLSKYFEINKKENTLHKKFVKIVVRKFPKDLTSKYEKKYIYRGYKYYVLIEITKRKKKRLI